MQTEGYTYRIEYGKSRNSKRKIVEVVRDFQSLKLVHAMLQVFGSTNTQKYQSNNNYENNLFTNA